MARPTTAVRALLLVGVLASGCGGQGAVPSTEPPTSVTAASTIVEGPILFGLPGSSTGLDETRCQPERILPGEATWVSMAKLRSPLVAN